jgi:peptide/nickel transport system substrate-binding protein
VAGLAGGPRVQVTRAQASGTLTIGLGIEPITMDPQFADGEYEYHFGVNVMDGLFTTGPNIEVVPRLAETWEQLDELTWEFRLLPDIMFQNGEPLTSEAVKVTYERAMDPDLAIRNTWGEDINLESVEVVDDLTFRFHTTEFTPHMLARLANDHFIYPPNYVRENDPTTVARHPIGTGPYVFQEWVAGERAVLTANPDFWGEPKPLIETVVWRFIPEATSRLASLETGEVDFIDALPPQAIAEVDASENLYSVFIDGTRRVYIGLNTKLKPTDDVRVRQALNYGTDVESICETILGGATTRMTNWVEPSFQNPDVTGYTYDPERARQLLAEAGYPDGIGVTMDYNEDSSLGMDEFPEAIAISLREVGVEVTLNLIEDNIHTENMRNRTTNQLYFRTNASYFDPGLTFDVWRLEHPGNASQFDDPEFLELRERLYTEGTPEERLEWSYEAQQRFMDGAPAIFLWKEPSIYGLSKRVQNFTPTGDERIRLAGMTLTE